MKINYKYVIIFIRIKYITSKEQFTSIFTIYISIFRLIFHEPQIARSVFF
jgi:hypothetical protein